MLSTTILIPSLVSTSKPQYPGSSAGPAARQTLHVACLTRSLLINAERAVVIKGNW